MSTPVAISPTQDNDLITTAFERIVKIVESYCRKSGCSKADTADICQGVSMLLWEHRRRMESAGRSDAEILKSLMRTPKSWPFGPRTLFQRARRRKNRGAPPPVNPGDSIPSVFLVPDPGPSAFRRVAAAQRVEILVNQVSEAHRKNLPIAAKNPEDRAFVAEAMRVSEPDLNGVSKGALGVRLHKARKAAKSVGVGIVLLIGLLSAWRHLSGGDVACDNGVHPIRGNRVGAPLAYGNTGRETGYVAYGNTGRETGYGNTGRETGYGNTGHETGYGNTGHETGYVAYGNTGHETGYGNTGHETGYGNIGHETGYVAYGNAGHETGYGNIGGSPNMA